jgi:hypothetical protein
LRPLCLALALAFSLPLAAQPASDSARPDTANRPIRADLSVWTRDSTSGLGFDGLPLRSVREVAALLPGVYRDFGDGTLFYRSASGAPSPQSGGVFDPARVGQAPTFVIDGVRVVGEPAVPFDAVEWVEVVEGYVPAQFGEAASGIVLVETKGGTDRYGGRIEGLSSAGIDAFGYNLGAFSASGPLGSARIGRFAVSGELRRLADATPFGGETYRLSDEAYADLLANPQVVATTDGSETRYVPFPWEAVQAANDAGRPFTNDDLRGALDLPAGFDLAPNNVLIDAPATYTAKRFERTRAKDDPLDGLTLHGSAAFDLASALDLRLGGTLDRERYDRTATPAERFTNALYNRDALYEADRAADRFYTALRYAPGRAVVELQADAQRWRAVQHPRGFSDDVEDALFYGDIDDAANAVARRYVVLRGGEYGFRYTSDAGARPGTVGGLFSLPGNPATVYRKTEGTALRLHGRAVVPVGRHRIEVGGEVERQTRRRFELAGGSLAQFYDDADGAVAPSEAFPDGVERYDQLPFEVLEPLIVTRYGYDFLGIETADDEDAQAYFDGANTDVAPYRPTYVAGYAEDRWSLGALTLRLGLRVEAFGSDATVPIDLYAPFPIARAGYDGLTDPADLLFQSAGYTAPQGIGSDYAVYFNDVGAIVGYRDLDGNFFDAGGSDTTPDAITGALSGQVEPIDAPRSTAFEEAPTHVVLSPRLGVRWDVAERAQAFAYYNRLARRPSALFFEPFTTFGALTGQSRIGNPRLEPEIADDLGFGVEGMLGAGLTVRATAFYRRQNQIVPRTLFGGFPSYGTYLNEGEATVYGLDLVGALAQTRGFALRAGYVLSFAEADANTLPGTLVQPTEVGGTFPSDFDVRHAVDVAADYRVPMGAGPRVAGVAVFGGVGVGAVFAAQSGRPYTALSGPGFSVTAPFTNPVGGELNEARLPWATQLDLRIEKRIPLGPGTLDAFVWVENVLDTRNTLAVYRATGEPDDDGFLGTAAGDAYITNQPSPASGTFNYLAFTGGPVNIGGVQSSGGPFFYGLPRRVRLGVRLGL